MAVLFKWYYNLLGMKYFLVLSVFLAGILPALAYTITPDTVSQDQSTISISPSQVSTDGVQKATVTVFVKNFSGTPLANKNVDIFIALSLGPISISPKSALSDQTGRVTFTLSSTTPGDATIRVDIDNGSILETHVQFVSAATCEFAPYLLVKSLDNPAVYFYGKDCKRHAFPDEKTYFGWYKDFDSVATLSSADIAKMPLGKNVTHRPGFRMIKFPSVDKVYAVSQGGILHWVTTEALAEALYGPHGINDYPPGEQWNQKIDDVSEAFYGNYSIGSDIHTVVDTLHTDYNPIFESSNVKTVDDNW
jgi:hypothetical protein